MAGRILRALVHHRFSVAMIVPLVVLTMLSGSAILEQLPDVQRRWASEGSRGWLHDGWAVVALVVVAVLLEVLARFRTGWAERHRSDARLAMESATPARRGHPVRIGFTVGATNPKTIVFFVAFLPQFTDPGGPVALQTMLLGLVFGVLAMASDGTWALAAGAARTWFARRPSRLDTLSAAGGTMMIGLGATMLTVD